MKKTTRVLVALLALTLVTSCFVGGTFAKYVVTGSDATDSARVAKFGVKIEAAGTMFADTYATDDGDVKGVIANSVIGLDGSDPDKVVAPGTKGNLTAISVTGTPEVAVAVSYVAVLDLGDNWVDKDGNYYCPLEIKVGDTTIKGTEKASADEFEAAVKTAIEGKAANYAPNTNLSDVNDDVVVSWAWAFGGNDDVKDTFLGDQAAAGTPATIDLTVTTTITQID